MGFITKPTIKYVRKTKKIKSSKRNKPNTGLQSPEILKTVDVSQNKVLKKTRKRYFIGEGKKTQRFRPKSQRKNKLKTAKTIQKFQVSDNVRLTPLEASVVSEHKHSLELKKVEACISAMLKFESKKSETKNLKLFEDEAQLIHMIVHGVRVPIMKNKNYRFCLPNPLVDESSDVCLIVPNLKKGKNVDHEPTIEYYKDILEKHKIKGISQIIPMRQINVEYDQYELRRRLVSQFDMFLADGRITGHVQGLIGKEIHKRRKLPMPVDLRVKDLKKEVDTAFSKTLMMMNGYGNKTSLKVGHTKLSVTQIAENILAVAEGLAKHFPGGWANIRSLEIHLQDSSPVPIYVSLKNSNDVKVPVVTYTLPKKAVPVEDEVSTMPGVRVTVLPDGEIIIKKKELTKEDREMGLTNSDLEDFNSDEEMDMITSDNETTEKDKVKVKKEPLPKTEVKEEDNTDSDASSVAGDEHVVEAAENAYLNQWSEQWNENIEENNRKRKEITVVEDVKDAPQTKKPKFIKDSRKKELPKQVKSRGMENKNAKKNNMLEKGASQTKKPTFMKDTTKKSLPKQVKKREMENKTYKKNNMAPQSAKKNVKFTKIHQ